MIEQPLVSVYMPTHNRLDLLKRAVDSVRAQTYDRWQLVVCDDGSTDGTGEWLSKVEAEVPRVLVVRNPTPRGAPHARNRAIEVAEGHWVLGLDDDDSLLPHALQTLVRASRESWSLVAGGADLLVSGKRSAMHAFAGVVTPELLGYGNFVGNQALFRKDLFLAVGGFDETLPAWQDYDLWFRLVAAHGPGLRLADVTQVLNQSHGSKRISHAGGNERGHAAFVKKHSAKLSERHLRSLELERRIQGEMPVSPRLAWSCWTTPNRARALNHLALTYLPESAYVAMRPLAIRLFRVLARNV